MDSDKTAIFVDGAFFIKRAMRIFGRVEPDDLANKLWSYSLRHIYPMHDIKKSALKPDARDRRETADFHYALEHLYRIFFYDCPPLPEVKKYCAEQVDTLWDEVLRFDNPHNYYVDLSQKLWNEKQRLLAEHGKKAEQ